MSNLFYKMLNWLDVEGVSYLLFDGYLIHYNSLGYETIRIVDNGSALNVMCNGGVYVCKNVPDFDIGEQLTIALNNDEREDWKEIHGVDDE